MNFVTADIHHRHEGILKICNRPFSNTSHQARELIKNFNAIVGKDDICYFLGDTYFGKHAEELAAFITKLNGIKIGIFGNHCEMKPFDYIRAGFHSMHTYLKVEEFNMVHDPSIAVMNRKEPWLVGHLHSSPGSCRHENFLDVGIDPHQYRPLSFEECRSYFK